MTSGHGAIALRIATTSSARSTLYVKRRCNAVRRLDIWWYARLRVMSRVESRCGMRHGEHVHVAGQRGGRAETLPARAPCRAARAPPDAAHACTVVPGGAVSATGPATDSIARFNSPATVRVLLRHQPW
jgi:hypothetical protein